MTRLINYDGQRRVMVYHTVPSRAGTSDFEHKSMASLADVRNGTRIGFDGSEDDPDTLVVQCPVEGCGTTVYVPLAGDADAQEFHARVRQARGEFRTLEEAREFVIARVRQQGYEPRIGLAGARGSAASQ